MAACACVSAGVGIKRIDRIIGVTKAYTTRVGEGPFPTELHDATGDHLRNRGGEFGATTGRPRRCGWFDAVVVKHAVRLNGLTDIALTKLDVLGGLEKIKICTAYKYRGTSISEYPAGLPVQQGCEPVYEELSGWDEDIRLAKDFSDLPSNAQRYVRLIAQLVGVEICMISLGEERSQTMLLRNPFHRIH